MIDNQRISFTFDPKTTNAATADAVVLVGTKAMLEGRGVVLPSLLHTAVSDSFPYDGVVAAILSGQKPGNAGASATSQIQRPASGAAKGAFMSLSTCVLPALVTRNNHPMSPHVITELLSSIVRSTPGRIVVYVFGVTGSNVGAVASACAKAMPPLYNRKSEQQEPKPLDVNICFLDGGGVPVALEKAASVLAAANAVAAGARLTARLCDMPPAELTTTRYSEECQKIKAELGNTVSFEEIVGEDLCARGYGGIYAVGKAAECPPRLIVMTYTPPSSDGPMETVALVGKGIVYDTGGLSIKATLGMCGMKFDMGGSAGLLGGFYACAKLGLKNKKITLLLCVAENAVGPLAVRNDDVITMYSKKTVEINNTDAEGRLVLGDGVAHATQNIENLDLVLNMCTLTGAQLISTGLKHAGVLSNTIEGERRIMDAGMASGDFCYPMLYCPELLKKEFASKVADLKNSVKDRGNAQSSCAGHFIESHINPDYKGVWIHVDMAGPAKKDERSTGFGPGLILSLLGASGF